MPTRPVPWSGMSLDQELPTRVERSLRPHDLLRWALAAALVVCAWVGGLLLWGAPQAGYRTASSLFGLFAVFVVGAPFGVVGTPLLVIGSLALGLSRSSSDGIRLVARGLWMLGLVGVAYPTLFVHVGGFCMDSSDDCVVPWADRVAGLLPSLVVLAVGVLAEIVAVRVRRFNSR